MTRQWALTGMCWFMVGVALMPLTVWAWDDLIEQHCVSYGIPKVIVQAMIQRESAGKPLAIGVAIKRKPHSFFKDHVSDAALLVAAFLRVTDNVGIGLLQITWGPWGDKLGVAPEALFDPDLNIRLACQRILKPELDGPGPLWERIGRYHSPTPERRDAYGWDIIRRVLETAGEDALVGF